MGRAWSGDPTLNVRLPEGLIVRRGRRADEAIEGPATSRRGRVEWRFIARGLATGFLILSFVVFAYTLTGFRLVKPIDSGWTDAHIYFRATQAWFDGADPWSATWQGIPFAAWPPALLLNVPLLPFGESWAVLFWIVANAVSTVYILWRLRLPPWWLLFYPLLEAFAGGSPDIVLAALVLAGGGAIAALAKPYAIPAMVAERRWTAIGIATAAAIGSLLVLPWGLFLEAQPRVAEAFRDHTVVVSAFGEPLLMAGTAIALVSLGFRRAAFLATPGLVAMQPHYVLFSLDAVRRSWILAFAMSTGQPRLAAVGIVVYASVEAGRALLRTDRFSRRWRQRGDPPIDHRRSSAASGLSGR